MPEESDALTLIYRSVLQEDNGRILLLLDNATDAGQVKPLLPFAKEIRGTPARPRSRTEREKFSSGPVIQGRCLSEPETAPATKADFAQRPGASTKPRVDSAI